MIAGEAARRETAADLASRMASDVVCPSCGESDRSAMTPRRDGERLFVTCNVCGHQWEHHRDRCPACGERSLVPVRVPLLQKARGTQQSIIGYRMARRCTACDWASEGPPPTSAVE
jgi:formate dehydrogenase maturation protein FdhE